ncbi:coiled-coil and C2 domain-containing protein 1A-like, partial [Geospiza fortis]|uniref:Coiled-coil and C2 domain-containing protein 1A-like n=1 Tax=Geospiza fortis TaxID=48883 RepID=A0A8N5F577_GEOFO
MQRPHSGARLRRLQRGLKRLQAQLDALGRGADHDPQVEESKDPPTKDPPTKDPPTKDPPTKDQPTKDQPKKDPAASSPEPPRDVREALEQRMERYRAALGQARASGDARKARMHERIVK